MHVDNWPLCPSPWGDPELDRLRHLKRQREVEQEKSRLEEWLRRNGMPKSASPFMLPAPVRPQAPSVEEVLRRIG